MLDHIAKPFIREGVIEPWDRDLKELANFENVWCKVSGMVTEARWKEWRAEDFKPYLDIVFGAFGPERIMIGSDWPVCTLSATYAETMKIALDYVGRMGSEREDDILGHNCLRFYDVE